jgi:hypothetical protein
MHYNIFGKNENVGSLILLILPTMLAFSMRSDVDEPHRRAVLIVTPIRRENPLFLLMDLV